MAGSVWPNLVAGARAKASEVESKFDWIEGDIVPMLGGSKVDATYDLGQSTFRFRDAYVSRQFLGPAGSLGTPSFSQNGAATNGIYFPTTSRVGTTNPLVVPDGTSAAPTLSFINAPTKGFYYDTTSTIRTAGQLLVPDNQYFYAIGSQTTIADTAYNSTLMTTLTTTWLEQTDSGSNFSTGVFTVPVAGKYLFHFKALIAADTVTTAYPIISLASINSSNANVGSMTRVDSVNQSKSLIVEVLAHCSVGDRIWAQVLATDNTITSVYTFTLAGDLFTTSSTPKTNPTHFWGCLIG